MLAEAQALHAFGVQSVATVNALAPHMERYQEMENLLVDPDRLAAYTVDFFTKVHPVNSQPVPQYQHPQLPPAHQSPGGIDLASIRPDQRWMVVDEMERQGLLQGKPLIIGN